MAATAHMLSTWRSTVSPISQCQTTLAYTRQLLSPENLYSEILFLIGPLSKSWGHLSIYCYGTSPSSKTDISCSWATACSPTVCISFYKWSNRHMVRVGYRSERTLFSALFRAALFERRSLGRGCDVIAQFTRSPTPTRSVHPAQLAFLGWTGVTERKVTEQTRSPNFLGQIVRMLVKKSNSARTRGKQTPLDPPSQEEASKTRTASMRLV